MKIKLNGALVNGAFITPLAMVLACLAALTLPLLCRANITPAIHRSTTEWRFDTTGVDPGPNWREPGFDDSAWSTGFGLFGFDQGYDTPFLTPLSLDSITRIHYFRAHFTWTGSTTGAVLSGRLYVDDGCVIWFNGVEFYRENVVDNPVTHQTIAHVANPRGEPVQFNFEVDLSTNTSNPLIEGDNVIAVSLHQAGIGRDIVFGLDLRGGVPSPPIIVNPELPADATVRQGFPHTLNVSATGFPDPAYQWFKDTSPIASATNAAYTITDMASADAGAYHVEVSNSLGTAVSRTATIGFLPDTNAPIALYGRIDATGTNVTVTFNEPMNPLYYDDFSLYIYPRFGDPFGDGLLVIVMGVLENETNWVFSTHQPATPGTPYSIHLFEGAVEDRNGNRLDQESIIHLDSEHLVFDFDGAWQYYELGDIDELNWKELGFDDSAWPGGPGLLGLEHNLSEGNLILPGHHIRTTFWPTGYGGPQYTTYLRKKIILPALDPARSSVFLDYIFDEGIVVFLNGTEILRRGVPLNETFSSLATSHEAELVDTLEVPLHALVAGHNILAVRVHDNAPASGDKVWGARLRLFGYDFHCGVPILTPPQPAIQTVAEGASVTYTVTALCFSPAPAFQWFKDGVLIPGATSSTLRIPVVTAADAGVYHAVASTGFPPNAVSGTATLLVEVNNPVLTSSIIREDGTVTLRFDKEMDPAVMVADGIFVYPAGGDPVSGNLGVTSGAVDRWTTWVLTLATPPATGVTYSIRLLPDVVYDRFGHGNLETTRVLDSEITLIPFDGIWSWIDTDIDNQNWKDLDYDDSLWTAGPGLLGTEPNLGPGNLTVPGHHIRTPFPATGTGAPGVTTYLRAKFPLPAQLVDKTSLILDCVFDDGIVVFLNGTEVQRSGLPTNAVYSTYASAHEADTIESFPIPVNLLVQGENLLAVRVHDAVIFSSDRVWGARLRVLGRFVPSTPVIVQAYVADGRLWIEISGDNVYLKSSPVLSPDPADYTTVSGPHSSGTIDAGPADGQRYFILGDTP